MHAMLVFGPVHGLPRWSIFQQEDIYQPCEFSDHLAQDHQHIFKSQGNFREQGTHTERTHPHGTPSISSHPKTPRSPHAAGFYSANQRPRVT